MDERFDCLMHLEALENDRQARLSMIHDAVERSPELVRAIFDERIPAEDGLPWLASRNRGVHEFSQEAHVALAELLFERGGDRQYVSRYEAYDVHEYKDGHSGKDRRGEHTFSCARRLKLLRDDSCLALTRYALLDVKGDPLPPWIKFPAVITEWLPPERVREIMESDHFVRERTSTDNGGM